MFVILVGALLAWGTYRISQFRGESIIADSEQISLGAATSFADAAREWILADDIQLLEQGVGIMLLGSAKYIQVNYQNQLLIDRRAGNWEEIVLSPPAVLPAKPVSNTFRFQNQRIVETTIPLRDRAFTIGFIRIGTHAQLLEAQLRRSSLTIGILGAIVWLVLTGATVLVAVRLARKAISIPARERTGSLITPIRELFAQRPIVIDLKSRTISGNGVSQLLTPKPFMLLSLLLSDSSRVFTDREIMEAIWPDCRYTSANDVHQCVYRLRKCLNDVEPDLGNCIANIKGHGYHFVADHRIGFTEANFKHAGVQ